MGGGAAPRPGHRTTAQAWPVRLRRRSLAEPPGAGARPCVLAWSARPAAENVNLPAHGKPPRTRLRRALRGAYSEPNPRFAGCPGSRRTATTARARASRIFVDARAHGSARRTLLCSPLPRPRCTTPIGSLRGEQAGGNDQRHGCTQSPARKGRIAVAGEDMRADHAANQHRDRDERHFGDAPPGIRPRTQRTPPVTRGPLHKLSQGPRDRDDGHHVSRSLVRGRDRLRATEDAQREDEPRRGHRTPNRCVVCLAGGP